VRLLNSRFINLARAAADIVEHPKSPDSFFRRVSARPSRAVPGRRDRADGTHLAGSRPVAPPRRSSSPIYPALRAYGLARAARWHEIDGGVNHHQVNRPRCVNWLTHPQGSADYWYGHSGRSQGASGRGEAMPRTDHRVRAYREPSLTWVNRLQEGKRHEHFCRLRCRCFAMRNDLCT